MGITIRGTASAMLLSATVLGLGIGLSGCANHEQAAAPGAGDSVSYGMPPATTSNSGTGGETMVPAAPSQADSTHNQADVTFLDDVVLLRQQAVQLATLGQSTATNPKLKTLCGQLAANVYPDAATLTGWLSQWNQPAPTAQSAQVDGLLTSSELSQLQAMSGTGFDSKLVSDLVANHQAVLSAANTEVTSGSNPQAKQVATNLVTAETAAVSQLNGLGIS
ncbi:MAG TPA: DUF305 domain-containing protein [Pseudonocardiaceae bacterium]|nr:DUF305 domain-containing protein [Pseudonocardiaceae bacterium]